MIIPTGWGGTARGLVAIASEVDGEARNEPSQSVAIQNSGTIYLLEALILGGYKEYMYRFNKCCDSH